MSRKTYDSARDRRPPRPTIRFLRLLPSDSFPNPRDAAAITRGRWADVTIGVIEHPLIADATTRFAVGMPDRHHEATRGAGRPVYEVRSRTGAAWRGAVILDDDGDPWLVWAAKHDAFHAHAKVALNPIDNWLPHPAEYKLRAREEAEAARNTWKRSAISTMLDALADAVGSPRGEASRLIVSFRDGDEPLRVVVAVEHEPPAGTPESDASLACVFVRVADHAQTEARDELLACVLPLLQPERDRLDAAYTLDGQIEVWVTMTHAKVAQLLALREISEGDHLESACAPNTVLHYVGAQFLAEALVTGGSTRAVCGAWFVPTMDERADLPVCERCEEQKPHAQAVIDVLRSLTRDD